MPHAADGARVMQATGRHETESRSIWRSILVRFSSQWTMPVIDTAEGGCATFSEQRVGASRNIRHCRFPLAAKRQSWSFAVPYFENVKASPGASTLMVWPGVNSPARIFRARGFSISCWMRRLRGRAP